MSDTTFQEYVEKQNLQFKNPKNIEKQKNETYYLQNTADVYKNDYMGYDAGGFDRELVGKAADFILKTKQYGLSAKSLDVSDSPIYYTEVKGKKCARGYFDRKKLTKAGNRLIDLAKKRQKEHADMLIHEELSFNAETWKPAETPPDAPPTEADNVIDRLVASETIEHVDECVREEMREKGNSVHFLQKRTYMAMDDKSDFPDLNLAVSKLNYRMMKDLQSFNWTGNKNDAQIEQKKKELKEDYHNRFKILKKMFTDAQNGLISPETLRVFLTKDLMVLDTSESIHRVYEKMEDRKKSGGISDSREYEKVMNRLTGLFQGGNVQEQGEDKQGFTHFRGKEFVEKKEPETLNRIYFTGKPDKQVEMVNALYKALEANPGFKDKIYLKVSSLPESKRMDNVVIYVSKLVTEKETKAMVAKFKSECGSGVLEGKENMLPACVYESDGVANSAEISLAKIYNALEPVLNTSTFEDNKQKARKDHSGKNPSFNQHIGQILFAAINMARKKHTDLGSGKDDKIEKNPEAMKDVKKYFNELLRLSNVDPKTMKRAV